MRIAVIGGGVAGLAAAHYLVKDHEVTLFEASDRLGGHTATVDVGGEPGPLAVDTGFIVFNDRTYPNFCELLDRLGVESQPSEMSFSVRDEDAGLEYAGSSLNALFAQRANLLSPRFINMLREILVFNRRVENDLLEHYPDTEITLGEYLERHQYSSAFREHYIFPMASAIWSSTLSKTRDMPLVFFVRFFRNHGLLQLFDRPQWRVIKGGSRSYIPPLTRPYLSGIRMNAQIKEVYRDGQAGQIIVSSRHGLETFKHVVFACHSDQALRILRDPSPMEKEILGAMKYGENEVVLHTDDALLPANRRCWSSWNVALDSASESPRITYNMNILQRLNTARTYCVTLNQSERIKTSAIIGRYLYHHPEFDFPAIRAQRRWSEINGERNTWYCGAYWRNGFHEDGVWSAKRVFESLQKTALLESAGRAKRANHGHP